MSVRHSVASFGLGTALGHASQLLWLAAGIRVMSGSDFGAVLAAQALYAILQIIVEFGTNSVGARLAARGDLDDRRRGEIFRMRWILTLAVIPAAVVLGGLHVAGSLAATLPFVTALLLFAVLNVWEPYGAGNARPWATYMFARSGALGGVALACLVADVRFPVPLAGALECLAILLVMVLFGSTPVTDVRLAVRMRGGPWASILSVTCPAFVSQSSIAAGTLVLSGSGRPAAAGIFAACVRLMSGVNAISGIAAMSLYPRLAQGAGIESRSDRQLVRTALRLIAVLTAGATAVCALFGGAIALALFSKSTDTVVAALVLTMATALPLGNVTMFAYSMLARGHERATVLPIVLGGPITVALALLAVVIAGAREDLVAASLLVGQLITMAGLGLRVRAVCPDLARDTSRAMATAMAVGLLAGASALSAWSLPAGLILVALIGAQLPGLPLLARSLRNGHPGVVTSTHADGGPRTPRS